MTAMALQQETPAPTTAGKTKTPGYQRVLNTVGVVGTLAGMDGIGRAMYKSLAAEDRTGIDWMAALEAGGLSLFLEGVVVGAAGRAKARAEDAGELAKFDVLLVLAAAGASGIISGWSAGWSAAALYRVVVPPVAAVIWLGDLVRILRRTRSQQHRDQPAGIWQQLRSRLLLRFGLVDHGLDPTELDRDRLLRRVIVTTARLARLRTVAGAQPGWWSRRQIARADDARAAALAEFETVGGDRAALADRVNAYHHRGDLDTPLAPSQWTALAAQSELAGIEQRLTTARVELVEAEEEARRAVAGRSRAVSGVEAELAGRRRAVVELGEQIEAAEARLRDLAQAAQDTEAELAGRSRAVEDADQALAGRSRAVAELDAEITTRQNLLAELTDTEAAARRAVAGRCRAIESETRAAAEADAHRIRQAGEQYAQKVVRLSESLPPAPREALPRAIEVARTATDTQPVTTYQLRTLLDVGGSTADALLPVLAQLGYPTTSSAQVNGTPVPAGR